MMRGMRRAAAAVVTVAMALAGVAGVAGVAGAARTGGGAARAVERARSAALETELEAARSHRLYLVLEPAGAALELKADGLVLRRFAVESALFGRSRLASGELAWPAYGFTLVSELQEPERPKIPIQAPEADPANAQAPVHATATPAFGAARDEAFEKIPTYYRLRFDPPLDVSILGEAGVANLPGRLWRARHRLLEGWEALAATLRGQTVPPRVVLTMTPDDARRLFVTLLPKTRLVVAGPDAAASGR
jgi:hypothetical protein